MPQSLWFLPTIVEGQVMSALCLISVVFRIPCARPKSPRAIGGSFCNRSTAVAGRSKTDAEPEFGSERRRLLGGRARTWKRSNSRRRSRWSAQQIRSPGGLSYGLPDWRKTIGVGSIMAKWCRSKTAISGNGWIEPWHTIGCNAARAHAPPKVPSRGRAAKAFDH